MNEGGPRLLAEDLEWLRTELVQGREVRDAAWQLSRKMSVLEAEAAGALQYGLPEAAAATAAGARGLLEAHEALTPHEKGCRDGILTSAYENFVKFQAFSEFLRTGTVLRRSELGPKFDDEEYLSGIIGTCQDLVRYALRRATAIDKRSVVLCRNFVSEVKAQLVGFDFRNGPLRRKFDGVKYAERRCEDLLYELSLSEESSRTAAGEQQDGRGESILDQDEWTQLQESYAEYDATRELVIKGCRDVQKAAKQAVYATQRGDTKKAQQLIASANAGAAQVWQEHVQDNPSLRFGSFAGALEELAEAEMFLAWRSSRGASGTSHLVPPRGELAGGLLTAVGYLGALSDFTGEVGRVAVEAATQRDLAEVRRCLEAAFAAHKVLASLPLVGKQLEKVQAAERNLWKLEAIEYDMAVRVGRGGARLQDQGPAAGEGGGE